MSLSIYQNLSALTAQKYLSGNQSAMQSSIERLSSGLRINHAADDASGLAISEKLRGQITGLQRASMNAQDGISMLQTAEGALEEVGSMLQRMRELAVQASNGTYTSNDRTEIQKEVDQLKAEIDRISTATEFNTKKLLNGDGTALWSSSSSNIQAIIRGNVAEGNYRINVATTPGKNQIYKTDIMTLNSDAIGTEIVTAGGNTNDTNIANITDASQLPTTGTSFYTVTVGDIATSASQSMSFMGSYLQAGSMFTVGSSTVSSSLTSSGYVEVSFENTITSTAAGTFTAKVRYVDAKTGWTGDWQDINVSGNGTVATISAGNTGTVLNEAGQPVNFDVTFNIQSGGEIQAGDKVLFSVSPRTVLGGGNNSIASSGGGTIQITGGPTGQAGPVLVYTGVNSLTKASNGDNFVDTNAVTVYYASINSETGNIDLGNMTVNFKEATNPNGTNGITDTGNLDLKVTGAGEAAATTTKLKDISVFTDADGNNLFENKQELTIWGNGKSATIYLEGDDTIADYEEKLTNAIVNDLGMGSSDNNVNSNLVDYVSLANPNGGIQSVEGTFIIQTALTGEQGELAFSGDENLINALSLNEIQASANNATKVTVYNAHTGELVGTDQTGDDRVYGVIDGVEMVLDSRAGVTESWNQNKDQVDFATNSSAAQQDYYLHIVDNSTDLQIGANSGQTLAVSIPQLDISGLGLGNMTIVSQKLAEAAIPDIDAAIDMVVSVRSTIGAQVNRLEHTINNLDTANENMTSAESRIRDVDMASEMSKFTNAQVLTQAGVSMLSQANQVPQMVLKLLQ